MAQVKLYDWKERTTVASADDMCGLESLAIACIAAKGKFELTLYDLDEPLELGEFEVFSENEWNYEVWLKGRRLWSGKFDSTVEEEIYRACKYENLTVMLWPENN